VVIKLDIADGYDFTVMEKKIRLCLLQSPWCVSHKPIRIEFLPAPDHGIEVTFHLMDKDYTEIARAKLNSLITT
jgi:hypothetical protein